MVRVKEWGTDLGRLTAVDEIFNDVVDRTATIEEARDRLHTLERKPPPYPRLLQWLATAGLCAAAAVFFRGRGIEVAFAAGAGLALGGVSWLLSRVRNGRFLADFCGALTAALFAWLVTHFRKDVSREVLVLSAVIPLVPGMTLTTGLAEVAQKNLVAGAARLTEAFVTFLSILFGIALMVGAETIVHTPAAATSARVGLALPYQVCALVVASVALCIVFSVPKRFIGGAVLSGAIGYASTALATRHLPGHVAAFLAALAISLFANASARVTQRPAQLFQLPGMMLLVPGSMGFLSLEDFLRGELVGGASKGFEMLLIGGALVTGILVANVVLPAKKLL
jgi:uncharacterized membrane protein YjjP (DUF1212 family)